MTDKKHILTAEERRQRNNDEARDNILQAAREVMREYGVADLNLQEIARKVGMRAPSLYNYFPGKTAIYDALFVMGMQMYRERLEQLLAQHGTSWEGLERILEGYLAFALENPELYQLMFERPIPGFVPSSEGLEESEKMIDIGRRITVDAIESGTLNTSDSVEVTMNFLIALMHGFTAQHLANEPHLPVGSGRFGSLIPVIIAVLKKAYAQ